MLGDLIKIWSKVEYWITVFCSYVWKIYVTFATYISKCWFSLKRFLSLPLSDWLWQSRKVVFGCKINGPIDHLIVVITQQKNILNQFTQKLVNIKRVCKKNRAQPGSNRWPIDLQSIALPLSYGPSYVTWCKYIYNISETDP